MRDRLVGDDPNFAATFSQPQNDGKRTKFDKRPAAHAFEIGELLPDERRWEAIGYGRIFADPTSSDPWVEVALAPLGWHEETGRFHWDGQAELVRVGVGTLPAIPLGSQWHHRRLVPPRNRVPKHAIVLGQSFLPKYCVGTTVADLAPNKPPLQARPLGEVADAPCYFVRFADGGSALVPALEVVRAALGPTSDFMKLVVEGYMETHPLRERWLFDIAASGWIDRADGRFRLQALRRLRAEELRVAARACADLNYRRAFHGVHASLAMGDLGPKYTRPSFPFACDSEWTFDETWFAAFDELGRVRRRRLITRIHDIRYSAGVRSLTVEIPVRETLDEDERSSEQSGDRQP